MDYEISFLGTHRLSTGYLTFYLKHFKEENIHDSADVFIPCIYPLTTKCILFSYSVGLTPKEESSSFSGHLFVPFFLLLTFRLSLDGLNGKITDSCSLIYHMRRNGITSSLHYRRLVWERKLAL